MEAILSSCRYTRSSTTDFQRIFYYKSIYNNQQINIGIVYPARTAKYLLTN